MTLSNSQLTNNDKGRQFQIFVRVWATFGLLLFASTWKLWTPQSEFPQIPFFEFLVNVPGVIDWFASAIVGLSLITVILARTNRAEMVSMWSFICAASVLIALNQHRLQPWAYQFVVFAIIIATSKPKTAFLSMRWIVISIYVYSAISKFDYQFIHTVGQTMLSTLATFAGQDTSTWPDGLKQSLAMGFPASELLIGIGLAIPKTRRLAMTAAVLMHAILVLVLWNLNHSTGVLLWNLFFIAQAVLLFSVNRIKTNSSVDVEPVPTKQQRWQHGFVPSMVTLFVILFPATEPLRIYDHWPAWQVYAPRTSRARFEQFNAMIEPIPNVETPWNDLDSWSNTTLRVPVYPQARFQIGVLMAVQQRSAVAASRSIEVLSQSGRWGGNRSTTMLTGSDQLKMRASRFWLNTTARSFGKHSTKPSDN